MGSTGQGGERRGPGAVGSRGRGVGSWREVGSRGRVWVLGAGSGEGAWGPWAGWGPRDRVGSSGQGRGPWAGWGPRGGVGDVLGVRAGSLEAGGVPGAGGVGPRAGSRREGVGSWAGWGPRGRVGGPRGGTGSLERGGVPGAGWGRPRGRVGSLERGGVPGGRVGGVLGVRRGPWSGGGVS